MSNSALRWAGVEGCACSDFDWALACVFFEGGVCAAVEGCAAPLEGAGATAGAFAAGDALGAAGALAGTGAAVLEAGALAAVFAAFGRALAGAAVAGFCAGAAAFALAVDGAVGAVFFGEVFCSPADLGLAGVGWDLGMEVALGGTCFADAAAALLALCGVASLATFAALGVTGLAEDLGEDAILEAEGIDREPLVRGLEMLTLLAEPIFLGAVLWGCVVAGCGFLVGIP